MKVYGVSRDTMDGTVTIDWTTHPDTLELLLCSFDGSIIPSLVATLDLPDGITPESIGLEDVIYLDPLSYITSLGYKDFKEYKRENDVQGFSL